VLRAIQGVDRRQALDAGEVLVLEAILLQQVRDGGREREREERDPEEAADDVEWQDRAAQARLVVDRSDEAGREEKRERLRRDESADHVDAKAQARDRVDEAREHRRHAQREVDPLDRADVQEERPDDDVGGVEGHADGHEPRRPARRPEESPPELGDEQDGCGQVDGRRGREEYVRQL